MTIRLNDDQAQSLEAVARVDGTPISETVRAAIDDRIAARRADPSFQDRLRRIMEENQQALERLAQ